MVIRNHVITDWLTDNIIQGIRNYIELKIFFGRIDSIFGKLFWLDLLFPQLLDVFQIIWFPEGVFSLVRTIPHYYCYATSKEILNIIFFSVFHIYFDYFDLLVGGDILKKGELKGEVEVKEN